MYEDVGSVVRSINSSSLFLGLPTPMPTLSSKLFQQLDLSNNHPLVNRLAHIIHGQRRTHYRRHSLHLDPCPANACHRGPDLDMSIVSTTRIMFYLSLGPFHPFPLWWV